MKERNRTKKAKKEGLTMISLKKISKNFNGQIVLQNVNLSIFEHESIALVGANGSGKSTLLKILAGILEPDEGKVEKLPDLKIAYFPQEISQENLKITGGEFFAREIGMEKGKVIGTVGNLCSQLGFPTEKLNVSIETLSGGEKSKLMLILILKSQADVFLLDEPTNNLDLQGLILLENFILKNHQSCLIVSHDRKFLDRLIDGVIEMDEESHNIKIYRNISYKAYLKERKRREEKKQQAYEAYQIKKQRLLETARRKKQEALRMARGPKERRDKDKYIVGFKKDRAKKIDSRVSAIEKQVSRLEELQPVKHRLPLNLHFQFSERSGEIVFQLKNAEVARNNFHLGPLDLEISYGDRIAIIGPNGQGKTTLLQVLAGKCKIDNGFFRVGSKVKIGYLPQEIDFKPEEWVLDYFLRITEIDQTNARRLLNRFGFSACDVQLAIQNLSPGEKSRLILATLMAQEINCLLLDEPTNHLDPEALDRLEQALKEFSGTIIMVSHDRYLIDQIDITKTYLMENGKLSDLRDYHEYERKFKI